MHLLNKTYDEDDNLYSYIESTRCLDLIDNLFALPLRRHFLHSGNQLFISINLRSQNLQKSLELFSFKTKILQNRKPSFPYQNRTETLQINYNTIIIKYFQKKEKKNSHNVSDFMLVVPLLTDVSFVPSSDNVIFKDNVGTNMAS